MRHPPATLILLATALMAPGPFAGAAEGTNLLLNGGAEQGKGDVPSVWFEASRRAEGLRMRRDETSPHSGAASLAISNDHDYPEPVSNNWAQPLQDVPAGKTIVLTAHVRTENADAANVCVQCWDSTSKKMVAYGSTPVFRGDQQWTRAKSEPVVVPPGTARVVVRAALTGKGSAWFDDLSVEVVDPADTAASRPQPVAQGVAPELEAMAPGRIVGVLPVTKDLMVLSYMPDWAHGSLDNIGIGNNEGGVRVLFDWEQPEQSGVAAKRYFLALYARQSTAPPDAVPGEEPLRLVPVTGKWGEGASWKTQPPVAEDAAVESVLAPGEGWKLIDVTTLVRARARPDSEVHGGLLRYAHEDRRPDSHTGFGFVSREGEAGRRPVVLVVPEKTEPER